MTDGDHVISCGFEGERIARHNHLRDTLYQTAVTAALAPSKEDMALQAAMVTQAATTPGHTLTHAYNRKMQGTGEAGPARGMV